MPASHFNEPHKHFSPKLNSPQEFLLDHLTGLLRVESLGSRKVIGKASFHDAADGDDGD